MNILNHIKERRTIRKFHQKKIPKSLLKKILEAGRMAPSAHNVQPWRFVVITDNKIRDCLVTRLKANSKKFLTSVQILVKKSLEILNGAPCIICVYDTEDFSKKLSFLGEPYISVIKLSEIESISAAIQNMHLTASSLGIGFVWLIFPVLLQKEINRIIKVEDKLTAVLAMGYPAEKPKKTSRKTLKEISLFI